MLLSSGPSGRASAVISRPVTSTTTSGRTKKLVSAALALREAEEQLVLALDLDVELRLVDEDHDHEQQQRERQDRDAAPVAAEQDAEADAEEAGHQQEVAEEADVGDVGRHPADEQQLDEEERRAGQEEADAVAAQRGEHRAAPSRTNSGWRITSWPPAARGGVAGVRGGGTRAATGLPAARHDRRASRRHRVGGQVARQPERPGGKRPAPGSREVVGRDQLDVRVAGIAQPGAQLGWRVAGPDERMRVCGACLDHLLCPPAQLARQREIDVHERMRSIDGGDDQPGARPQPAVDDAEGGHRVGEVLDREGRERQVEGPFGKGVGVAAQVGDVELVEPFEGACRLVDVHADEPADALPERAQLAEPAAARVERRGASVGERLVKPLLDDVLRGRYETQAPRDPRIGGNCGGAVGLLRDRHHAVAVADWLMPSLSSQRSASIAALQPSPAAVTAWR